MSSTDVQLEGCCDATRWSQSIANYGLSPIWTHMMLDKLRKTSKLGFWKPEFLAEEMRDFQIRPAKFSFRDCTTMVSYCFCADTFASLGMRVFPFWS